MHRKLSLHIRLTAILLLCVCFGSQLPAQTQIPVNFDERTDLLSVVFRLAGNSEYNLCEMTFYADNVDQHFAPYKNHQVVTLAKQYYRTGIGYDAVASFAMHIVLPTNDKESITIDPQFEAGGDRSFDRWSEQQKQEFLQPLTDFYRQSHFHQWYESTAEIRSQAISSFNENISQNIDLKWFDNFFGPLHGAQFQIVLSLLVGPNNYGCSATLNNGGTLLSPVIGCALPDKEGKPTYEQMNVILPIVIHEFCHAYCNPLNEKHWKEMKTTADKVFKLSRTQISQAYDNSKTMMDETFVRSCVIRYQLAHSKKANLLQLIREEKGFILVSTLVKSLGEYEQQRTQYSNMESYMPKLIQDINHFDIKKHKTEQKNILKNCAHVVKCNIKNGDKNIPAGQFTLSISFDKAMQPGIALGYGNSDGKFLTLAKNVAEAYFWSEDKKTIHIALDLEPDTHYAFSILGEQFRTSDGYHAIGTHFIDFWTNK